MTLEKHMIDTMKEWQLKMGTLDSGIKLYYPGASLCQYTGQTGSGRELVAFLEKYLEEKVPFLGRIEVSYSGDRFCLSVGKDGCIYVEQHIDTPEFLAAFLAALKTQRMEEISAVFEADAKKHHTSVICEAEEDGIGTAFYMKDENVEPYVYCVEQDAFGITYHRFAKSDYEHLK